MLFRRTTLILLTLASIAHAQSRIHWKGLREEIAPEREAPPVKRWMTERGYWLADLGHIPDANDRFRLQREHLEIVGAAPDTGLLVAGPGRPGLRRLLPDEKVSAAPEGEGAERWFIVEFYPDVDEATARAIVLLEGMPVRENLSLAPNHLLVEADRVRLFSLAQWDEVAYVFPASKELVEQMPVYRCGAVSGSGYVGQSIPLIGEGWDGPGLGAATLSYAFYSVTAQVPEDQVTAAVASALNQWASYAALTFVRDTKPSGNRTIGIRFAKGAHGDPYPFGPAGGVLAHTFYPHPVNPEPIAGDMHFNDANTWNVGSNVDVFSVALHEAGHALGLGHSDNPSAVMYPYYHQVTSLSAEDVSAIQELYAARNGTPPDTGGPGSGGSGSGGSGSGGSGSGGSGSGGSGGSGGKDTTPPSLRILSPTSTSFFTSLGSVELAGIANDNVGVTSVSWSSSTGASGSAAGTTRWRTSPIPLFEGTNMITIVASDGAGNRSWRTVVVRKL